VAEAAAAVLLGEVETFFRSLVLLLSLPPSLPLRLGSGSFCLLFFLSPALPPSPTSYCELARSEIILRK